jgi:hypothetical protein
MSGHNQSQTLFNELSQLSPSHHQSDTLLSPTTPPPDSSQVSYQATILYIPYWPLQHFFQVLNRLVAKQPFITFLVTLQCSLKIQAKLITIAKQPSITFHNDQCNATSRFRHNDFPPYILQHKNIPPKGARHYILDFFNSFVVDRNMLTAIFIHWIFVNSIIGLGLGL